MVAFLDACGGLGEVVRFLVFLRTCECTCGTVGGAKEARETNIR